MNESLQVTSLALFWGNGGGGVLCSSTPASVSGSLQIAVSQASGLMLSLHSSETIGPAPTQTRSGAWGWLASSSQILNHSAFHQSFMLIQLSAFGIVSPPQKVFRNPCQGRMKTGRLYDVLTLGRLSDRISA